MPKVAPKIHITLTFTQDELELIERFRLSFDKTAFRNEALMEAVRRSLPVEPEEEAPY
jgi:hypothetical protein